MLDPPEALNGEDGERRPLCSAPGCNEGADEQRLSSFGVNRTDDREVSEPSRPETGCNADLPVAAGIAGKCECASPDNKGVRARASAGTEAGC
mmetsp:Transcript_82049/g.235736  ORF Transcript_82049/g.235736 Transcript_82049/m.235736 type:complete len:93 (+) Transcript_82049:324-602(+)